MPEKKEKRANKEEAAKVNTSQKKQLRAIFIRFWSACQDPHFKNPEAIEQLYFNAYFKGLSLFT